MNRPLTIRKGACGHWHVLITIGFDVYVSPVKFDSFSELLVWLNDHNTYRIMMNASYGK